MELKRMNSEKKGGIRESVCVHTHAAIDLLMRRFMLCAWD